MGKEEGQTGWEVGQIDPLGTGGNSGSLFGVVLQRVSKMQFPFSNLVTPLLSLHPTRMLSPTHQDTPKDSPCSSICDLNGLETNGRSLHAEVVESITDIPSLKSSAALHKTGWVVCSDMKRISSKCCWGKKSKSNIFNIITWVLKEKPRHECVNGYWYKCREKGLEEWTPIFWGREQVGTGCWQTLSLDALHTIPVLYEFLTVKTYSYFPASLLKPTKLPKRKQSKKREHGWCLLLFLQGIFPHLEHAVWNFFLPQLLSVPQENVSLMRAGTSA